MKNVNEFIANVKNLLTSNVNEYYEASPSYLTDYDLNTDDVIYVYFVPEPNEDRLTMGSLSIEKLMDLLQKIKNLCQEYENYYHDINVFLSDFIISIRVN